MSKLRMKMTSSDQKKLLEDFYDQLDDDTFLGTSFEDEGVAVVVIEPELSSDDDDDDDVIDELKLDNADNVVEEPHVPRLPRKQGFANLDEVTNYENFDPIPPREHATLWYSNKNESPVRNVLSKRAGPTRQTSSFETSLDGFSYFMSETIITKRSILDVAAALDPPLFCSFWRTQIKKTRIFAIVLLIMQIIFIKLNIASYLTWSNRKHFSDCCIYELR